VDVSASDVQISEGTRTIMKSLKNILLSLSICTILAGFLALTMLGQENMPRSERVPRPDKEAFTPASGLMMPWRYSDRGCDGITSRHKLPGCADVRGPEIEQRVMMALYNEDGSLWYEFDIRVKDGVPPDFLRENFIPLAPKRRMDDLFTMVVLRLVGEAPDWYKVEVNEDTRETKYILRSDKNWARVGWEFFFNYSQRIEIDQKVTKLR
jgi:hypothetical protein